VIQENELRTSRQGKKFKSKQKQLIQRNYLCVLAKQLKEMKGSGVCFYDILPLKSKLSIM